MNQTSHLPSVHHSFNIELATKLGSVDLAILVHHFLYWITYNKRMKKNCIEGKTWMYSTHAAIATHFPYWSIHQVKRLIKRLEDLEIITKGNFNASAYDKTTWYSFNNEEEWGISNTDYDSAKRLIEEKEGNAEQENKKINTKEHSVSPTDDIVSPTDDIACSIIKHAIPQSKPHSLKVTVMAQAREADGLAKTVASKKSSKKTMEAPQRFGLDAQQKETYRWLKEEQINVTVDTLCYWVKTYSPMRLAAVLQEARSHNAKSIGGYMNSLLKKGAVVNSAMSEQNRQFARDYRKANDWFDLEINKKYVSYKTNGIKETLSLNIDPMEFARHLMSKHESGNRSRSQDFSPFEIFNPADYDD